MGPQTAQGPMSTAEPPGVPVTPQAQVQQTLAKGAEPQYQLAEGGLKEVPVTPPKPARETALHLGAFGESVLPGKGPAPQAEPQEPKLGVAQAPGTGATKARWQGTTREEQRTMYAPEEMAKLSTATKQAAKEEAWATEDVGMRHQQEAARLAGEGRMLDELAQQRRAAIDRQIQAVEAERVRIDQQQIDPTKYWTDRGALVGILSALASGGGAYAAILGRSKNFAGETIDKAVEQDIEAQKASIASRRQGLQTRMTLLDHYARNNDPDTAERMARITLRDSAASMIKGEEQQGLAYSMRSKSDAELAKLQAEASKSTVRAGEKFVPASSGGGGQRWDLDLLRQHGLVDEKGNPKASKAQIDDFLKTYYHSQAVAGGSVAEKGRPGGGGGGGIALTLEGKPFEVKDTPTQRVALKIAGVEQAIQEHAANYKQALDEFRKAVPGTADYASAANRVRTLRMGTIDMRATQIAINSGAARGPTEKIRQMAEHEVGEDPTEHVIRGKLPVLNMVPNTTWSAKQRVDAMLGSGKQVASTMLNRFAKGEIADPAMQEAAKNAEIEGGR